MAQTAGARRTHVRGAPSPVLPDEFVLWEILVRLPAKELLRCRAVCRSWCRLTSAADFLLAHHRRRPSLPLVAFRDLRKPNHDRVDAALDTLNLRRSPAERRPVLRFNDLIYRGSYEVHGSCDGLLLVSLGMKQYYYICNPATRQWLSLPNLMYHNAIGGLYRHSSSGEYRILDWKWIKSNMAIYRRCYVLTVGSSMAPRDVGKVLDARVTTDRPVLLHDCLHWIHCKQEKVLVFDTVGESFRWMNAPTDQINGTESHLVQINALTDDNSWIKPHLVEINGTLGISRIKQSRTMMKLWILQNYEAEVWLMKYQIQLPVVELTSIANSSHFSGTVLSENGDVLVYCDKRSNLFHCDNTGKLLQKLQWDGVFSQPTGLWFKESLVQHAFFQTRDGRCARNPRIFEGL